MSMSKQAIEELVANIKSGNNRQRGKAWQNAGPAGAPAIGPLEDFHGDVCLVRSQSLVGAEPARQVKSRLVEIDGDDPPATDSSQRLHDQQADHPRADDPKPVFLCH